MDKSDLAPIVLFVYNRPWHTQQTLEALMKNDLADESELFIYSDGLKNGGNVIDLEEIHKVREVIHEKQWCKSVNIIEREENLGLADSVITGVTEIIKKYGKVIVLEDDIVTARFFLRFINGGLNIYLTEEIVQSVTGYIEPIPIKKREAIFLQKGSSWGWATWRRAWYKKIFDVNKLHKELSEHPDQSKFDFGGYPYFDMLKSQFDGKINSWAIQYYTYGFLNGKLHLNPPKSLVRNIGFDGSGVHCGVNETYDVILKEIDFQFPNQIIDRSIEVNPLLKSFYKSRQRKEKLKYYFNRVGDLF